MTERRVPTVSPDLVASIVAKVAAKRRVEVAPVEAPPAPPRQPYHEAAAVLAAFDAQTLVPLGSTQDAYAPVDALLADSVQIARGSDATMRSWSLKPGVRVRYLRELRQENRIAEALARNPVDPANPFDRMLRAFLQGSAPALTAMSRDELAAASEVTAWLREAEFPGLPTREEIIGRFEWSALLEPFEHLAGLHFGGRVPELRILREYADVVPPDTPSGAPPAAPATVDPAAGFTQKPPLVIFGPGGVGKSSLVARFILEHARAHEEMRFPFVYLDFDRAEIAFDQPVGLLVEAVRQLGVQYPDARERCEALRRAWLADFSPRQPGTQSSSTERFGPLSAAAMADLLRRATRDFVTLLRSLGAANRPVLFVLDTFEEVQRRSDESVGAIWHLLDDLRTSIPRLRAVVVGRADVPNRETQKLPLKGLDEEAAVAYLVGRGVQDPAVATRLARQLGGSPMSLKLAAEMFNLAGLKDLGDVDIPTRESFYLRVDDALIQRQLYMRILSYVHDEEVRRLAHPGLVLRRLTPELILNVLKGPCGLDEIETLDQARELFQRLRREVSLVTDVDGNTVKHRSDLRLLMVPLVRSSEAAKAREIDTKAVAFYEQDGSVTSRAEEIYHRLWLEQPLESISGRWLRGVEPLLAPAMDEFSGARKAFLASHLGLEIDEETRQLAELQDWERLTERRASELIQSNDPHGALTQLRARTDRTPKSPLPQIEAIALVMIEHGDEALEVLDEGIRRAIEAGDRQHALSMATYAARMAIRFERADVASRYVTRFKGFEQPSADPIDRLAVLVPLWAMSDFQSVLESAEQTTSRTDLPEFEREALAAFDAASDAALTEQRELALWLATLTVDPKRLARVLRILPISPIRASAVRQLAAELARFEVNLSAATGEAPGPLARAYGLAMRPTLTETWSDYLVRDELTDEARNTVASILERYGKETPVDVIDSVRKLPRFALGFEHDSVRRMTFEVPAQPPQTTALSGADMKVFIEALLDAFPTLQELQELLYFRLDRNLESLVDVSQALRVVVFKVVQAAAAQGWLPELVTAALEARPANPKIQSIAEAAGVSSLPSAWREQLNLLLGQVCRVEVGAGTHGTGFLIGPDVVLTADQLLIDVHEGRLTSADVICRFDYKKDASGAVVSQGTVFQLEHLWLAARNPWKSESEGLGYCLLRVKDSPGVQPIGGSTFESASTLRRWIELPPSPRLPIGSEGLLILQYPDDGQLEAAMDFDIGNELSPDRTRFYHHVNTVAGSAGSPCFGFQDMQLVGMHVATSQGPDGKPVNVAVTMAAIVEDMRRQGFGAVAFA